MKRQRLQWAKWQYFQNDSQPRQKRAHPEHDIQVSFFDEVRLRRLRDNRWNLVFAIPNGEIRHWSAAKRLKREGVEPGIPDVFCAVPSGKYAGLWLEFKAPKGSLSDAQKEKAELLRLAGYRVEVVKNTDAAIAIVEEYLRNASKF